MMVLTAEKLESPDVPLNVLVPVFGVSVDKCLALRGDSALQSLDFHQRHHIHANLPPLNSETLAQLREQLRINEENHAPENSQPK